MTSTRPTTKDSHSLENRLSRLEAVVENFVDTISRDIQQQNANISSLRQAFQENNRTPWTNVFAGATIILLITGMLGSGYVRDLNRVEGLQSKLLDSFNTHAADGHPRRVEERIDSYKKFDDDRTRKLQEEVDEVSAYKGKIHQFGERLRALERKSFGYGHKVNGLD